MSEVQHRVVETNGIRLHVAEQGEGPLVLLCHGFPESWYSWRHQLRALAEAGFHAVAPDMRGYGQSEAPTEIGQAEAPITRTEAVPRPEPRARRSFVSSIGIWSDVSV